MPRLPGRSTLFGCACGNGNRTRVSGCPHPTQSLRQRRIIDMKQLAIALIFASLIGCSSLAHKGIDIEGNPTTGAGVTADRSGLKLNGVVSYHSTTPEIERERAKIAEAKAREAEALLALAQMRAATALTTG